MTVSALIAAASLAAALPAPAPASPQDAAVAPRDPIRLEDVVVDARRLDEAAEAYVDLIANPVRRRGLARWKEGVCVGVANLRPDYAQALADRVSDVVRSVGLSAHEPECHPSVLIMATSDAPGFTRDLVSRRPRLFRVGASGTDQGTAALRRFMDAERPVRWWHISLPVDSETGLSIVRFPGMISGSGARAGVDETSSVQDYAPITAVNAPSRITDQYEDVLKRVFIVVDVDQLNGATIEQLGDYLAMVALAQIDPEAQAGAFDTILNLFEDPAVAPPGLTGWDRAYLEGLYAPGSESNRINERAQVQAVADSIARAYRGANQSDPGAGD